MDVSLVLTRRSYMNVYSMNVWTYYSTSSKKSFWSFIGKIFGPIDRLFAVHGPFHERSWERLMNMQCTLRGRSSDQSFISHLRHICTRNVYCMSIIRSQGRSWNVQCTVTKWSVVSGLNPPFPSFPLIFIYLLVY